MLRMEAESTLTSKGQITVPKSIRNQLRLHTGEKVLFVVEDHAVRMVPRLPQGLAGLRILRQHISFTDAQLNRLLKESKRAWE